MSSITKTYCDICGEEVWNNYIVIKIYIGDRRKWHEHGDWQYQEEEHILVCDDCVGSEITRCNGSHGVLNVKDRCIALLKKFKLVK